MKNNVLMPFKNHDHIHRHCLDNAMQNAEQTCHKMGLKLTRLRKSVLELIWQSHEPVKAYDVLDKLKKYGFSSAPPTVYRALDFLQSAGMVHKIESLNAYVGCAESQDSHQSQFLICRQCGSVAELADDEIQKFLEKKARALKFEIETETVEITGICSSCK